MNKCTQYIFLLLLFGCAFNPSNTSQQKLSQLFKKNQKIENKGKYVTSANELRVLFVFVIFNDDTLKSDGWKLSTTEMPLWANKIINNSTELNFPNNNLTQYFYEMSQGNFMLYGDVYPKILVPEKNQSEYKTIEEVNSEILNRIDSEVDFSNYDNWTKSKTGNYINEPDGKVDMIFILYRDFENRLYFNNGWTGIAHLYLTEDVKTNDGVKITKGRLDQGSGIQSRGGKIGFDYSKYVLAHEFGHFLFGAGHIENLTNLSLMTGGPVWNASRGMHSWEREKLGWINFIDININENSKIEIDDYLTTGEAYRIKLNENEWYILENHQKLSVNDWAQTKGVYIYHVRNAQNFAPTITVECADGNWDFKIDEVNQKLYRTTPNILGKNEMNFSKNIKKKNYACFDEVYGNNDAWGDEFDAFNSTYNNLFSPVSNPSSLNNSKIDFAIEVKEQKENKYLVDIIFQEIYKNTSPSKPQILSLESDVDNKIILNWLGNKEPDLTGYNLYYFDENRKERVKFISLDKTSLNLSNMLHSATNNFSLTSIDVDKNESVKNNFYINKKNDSWALDRKE